MRRLLMLLTALTPAVLIDHVTGRHLTQWNL